MKEQEIRILPHHGKGRDVLNLYRRLFGLCGGLNSIFSWSEDRILSEAVRWSLCMCGFWHHFSIYFMKSTEGLFRWIGLSVFS
jgi:hypothetical protein